MGIETLVQFCLYLCCIAAVADQGENSGNAIVWNTLELLDFTLTFYYQTDSNTLYTTCRKGWLNLSPQDRRKLETYQSVEYTTSLLGIHQVHVQMAWVLDCVKNSLFGNLVEDNTVCLLLIQSQYFAKVPADGFSLAVLIGC